MSNSSKVMVIPGALQSLRKQWNLTQGDVGDKIGLSKQTICHIERGVTPVKKIVAKEIAKILHCELADFVQGATPRLYLNSKAFTQLLEQTGMTQADVGKIIGTTSSQISKWKLERRPIDLKICQKMAGVFKCDIGDFITSEKPKCVLAEKVSMKKPQVSPPPSSESLDILNHLIISNAPLSVLGWFTKNMLSKTSKTQVELIQELLTSSELTILKPEQQIEAIKAILTYEY